MIIKKRLNKAINVLSKNNFNSPIIEAELLLSFVLKKNKEFFYSHPEFKINFFKNIFFNYVLHKRLAGWPIAYIVGQKEFYGLSFIVNKNVLIPRPETEIIVDEALKIANNYQLKTVNVIDVGTGSGCIVISLAKKLKKIGLSSNFFGLDISKKALKIAKNNAVKNNLDSCINFLHSCLLKEISFEKIEGPIIITANLPYLTSKQVMNSLSIKKEPRLALISGLDGLDHYRLLFEQIVNNLQFFKNNVWVLCEIDNTQREKIIKLAINKLPLASLEIKKDLDGFDRLVVIKIK